MSSRGFTDFQKTPCDYSLFPVLIGSRAAREHMPSFREPRDFDVVAQWKDYDKYSFDLAKTIDLDALVWGRKYKSTIDTKDGPTLETTLVDPALDDSTCMLLRMANDEKHRPSGRKFVTVFGLKCLVCPLPLLFAIKYAHSPRPIHWIKTIEDLHFFKKHGVGLRDSGSDGERYVQLLRHELSMSEMTYERVCGAFPEGLQREIKKMTRKKNNARKSRSRATSKMTQDQLMVYLQQRLNKAIQDIPREQVGPGLMQRVYSVMLQREYLMATEVMRNLIIVRYPQFKFVPPSSGEEKKVWDKAKVLDLKETSYDLDWGCGVAHDYFRVDHYLLACDVGDILPQCLIVLIATYVSPDMKEDDDLQGKSPMLNMLRLHCDSSSSSSSEREDQCVCNSLMWAHCPLHPCTCGAGYMARPYHKPHCYHYLARF